MNRKLIAAAASALVATAFVVIPSTPASATTKYQSKDCPSGYHIRSYSSGGWGGQTHIYSRINGGTGYREEYSVSSAFWSPRGITSINKANITLKNNAGVGSVPSNAKFSIGCYSNNYPW